jgi:hypothetical protein
VRQRDVVVDKGGNARKKSEDCQRPAGGVVGHDEGQDPLHVNLVQFVTTLLLCEVPMEVLLLLTVNLGCYSSQSQMFRQFRPLG